MEGYTDLFSKFLAADAQEAVKWEQIEKLPKDAVSVSRKKIINLYNSF